MESHAGTSKDLSDDVPMSFKTELVNKILHSSFKDTKTKVSPDGLKMMSEFLRLFVEEAIARSEIQAETEGIDKILIEHLEKVLPQLLLDF